MITQKIEKELSDTELRKLIVEVFNESHSTALTPMAIFQLLKHSKGVSFPNFNDVDLFIKILGDLFRNKVVEIGSLLMDVLKDGTFVANPSFILAKQPE